MSNADDTRIGIRHLARNAAAVLFVLIVGMGSTVSPQVEGAIETPFEPGESTVVEPEFRPSACAVDGLVFADCNLDF